MHTATDYFGDGTLKKLLSQFYSDLHYSPGGIGNDDDGVTNTIPLIRVLLPEKKREDILRIV